MRVPRIYQNKEIIPKNTLLLDEIASRHLTTVLRLEKNDKVILFNGNGKDYPAFIQNKKRHHIEVYIETSMQKDMESSLAIHLGQGISKGDRMDFTIQKATELGITQITPLFTARSEVHLKGERQQKKMEHWHKVIISACEQCGRNHIPKLLNPISIHEWIMNCQEKTKITLDHTATKRFKEISFSNSIALLIGPEGGLTFEEKIYSENHSFTSLSLGPRTLRTETASIVAITALQLLAGDL